MENVLKSNLAVLKEVSKMISVETGCNIIICDHEGEIIEATLRERIGRRHMGSILILAGESDEAVITGELEERYKKDGTDTRVGYNYVINILGKRVGSLGVAGEPEFLKPIVRIAAKTIGFYISEYLREREKNKILEKMAKIRTQAEAALKKSEAELKKTLSILDSFWTHSPNPICIMDRSGRVIRISRSISRLINKSIQEIEGHSLNETFQPRLARILTERLEELNNRQEPVCYSDDISLANGENRHYDTWVFPVLHDGEDSDLIGIVSLDVTDRKMNEERLRYLSHHDSLTGIHNRTFFEKEIKRLTISNDYPISILSLDADGLKMINDTLGHDEGDKLLQNLAQILRRSLRDSDILARVGGDEFVILLPKAGKDTAQMIAERITINIDLHNKEYPGLPISVSIGLCTVEHPGKCLEDVLKKADERMYHNKLNQQASSRNQILNSLMAALSERDNITQGHTRRLMDLALKIGERKKLPHQVLSSLALLCQVHDLGKVSIPDDILRKQESLTVEEWEIIRQHPEKGYRIAMVSSPELGEIAELILKHHERWDGQGYPLGLEKNQIPLECRILAVVDAYDAMLNERPYNQAKTQEEAVQELKKCAGSQFDREIVQLLLEVLENEQEDNRNKQ